MVKLKSKKEKLKKEKEKEKEEEKEEEKEQEKEGRKPYNKEEPRLPIDGIPLRETPYDYVSIQDQINKGPGKTIDTEELLKYVEKLKKMGFEKLEPENYEIIGPGERFGYVTNDNKWRSGGFLVSKDNSDSAFIDGQTIRHAYTETRPYILYRGFNNALYSLQIEDVFEFWHKPKRIAFTTNTVIFKKPVTFTNFPVTLPNDQGIDTVVYFARDSFIKKRFLTSIKYQRALEYGWMFDDGTQTLNLDVILLEQEDSSGSE
jgi:hypothetical protein